MTKFTCVHNNFNVLDLEKSVAFYQEALVLHVIRQRTAEDGSFILTFMGDDTSSHQVELTWLRDRKEPYDLGDNEIHLAYMAQDIDEAHRHHEQMGCICFENPGMGIYFIEDPDGYWIEIVPDRSKQGK